MERKNSDRRIGSAVLGVALGLAAGIAAPLLLMVQALIPVMLVPLASLAIVALDVRFGLAGSLSCAAVMVGFALGCEPGGTLALVCLFLIALPSLALRWLRNRPFFEQLRLAIALYAVGMLLSVLALYLRFGANMIAQLFNTFPEMLRAMPEAYVEALRQRMSGFLGTELTLQGLYDAYDEMVFAMTEVYQLELPEHLFSGTLMCAVLCTWLANRMRARRGEAAPGSYVPLREWALPASTTGGLALLSGATWALTLFGMNGAETVFYAAYGIAAVGFGFQAMGSFARKLRETSLRPQTQRLALAAIAAVGFIWLPDALMVYGGASAILGSRGVLAQRAKERQDEDDDDDPFR